jgi:hypothetical protein
VNKTRIEDHIASTLKFVTIAFPQLAKIWKTLNYEELYPILQNLTENIVLYSMTAAQYYKVYWPGMSSTTSNSNGKAV